MISSWTITGVPRTISVYIFAGILNILFCDILRSATNVPKKSGFIFARYNIPQKRIDNFMVYIEHIVTKIIPSTNKKVFYIGDAFNGFLPTLAQGASQSIESAFEIFNFLFYFDSCIYRYIFSL